MSNTFRCAECGRVFDNSDVCPECGSPALYTNHEGELLSDPDWDEIDLDEDEELQDYFEAEEDEEIEELCEDVEVDDEEFDEDLEEDAEDDR